MGRIRHLPGQVNRGDTTNYPVQGHPPPNEATDPCGGCGHTRHIGRCFTVGGGSGRSYAQCTCDWRDGVKGKGRRKP